MQAGPNLKWAYILEVIPLFWSLLLLECPLVCRDASELCAHREARTAFTIDDDGHRHSIPLERGHHVCSLES
jgi:hypothetical protein